MKFYKCDYCLKECDNFAIWHGMDSEIAENLKLGKSSKTLSGYHIHQASFIIKTISHGNEKVDICYKCLKKILLHFLNNIVQYEIDGE